MFIEYIFKDFQFYFFVILIAGTSVVLHELAHAFAAFSQGDDTAKKLGYFTLNPIVHMGKTSIIILLLFGICWGACPVTPEKFKHRYSNAFVSFAGPLANILLVFLFAFLGVLTINSGSTTLPANVINNLEKFFWIGSYLNVALFLFNMIPLPPLDGASIVQNILPDTSEFYHKIGPNGFMVVFLLLWIPGVGKTFWGFAAEIAKMAVKCCQLLFMF